MGLGRLLEACQVYTNIHEKVGLEHSSKSTKYELEGSYNDPVHEHFSCLKTAKLPRDCDAHEISHSVGITWIPIVVLSMLCCVYYVNHGATSLFPYCYRILLCES